MFLQQTDVMAQDRKARKHRGGPKRSGFRPHGKVPPQAGRPQPALPHKLAKQLGLDAEPAAGPSRDELDDMRDFRTGLASPGGPASSDEAADTGPGVAVMGAAIGFVSRAERCRQQRMLI